MFLEFIIALILGIITGTLTGLFPGIHINLVATLLTASLGFFTSMNIPLIRSEERR